MNLFSRENQNSFDRLLRSLSGAIAGSGPIKKQSSPLSEEQVNRVLGTGEEFMRKI
jgi:hypothetical protein